MLGTTGHFNSMAIAFRNPDGTIAVVVQNALEPQCRSSSPNPADASRGIKATLAPRSFNTFVIEQRPRPYRSQAGHNALSRHRFAHVRPCWSVWAGVPGGRAVEDLRVRPHKPQPGPSESQVAGRASAGNP